MALPSTRAQLSAIEKYRAQVLAHPLARGISPDEVRGSSGASAPVSAFHA